MRSALSFDFFLRLDAVEPVEEALQRVHRFITPSNQDPNGLLYAKHPSYSAALAPPIIAIDMAATARGFSCGACAHCQRQSVQNCSLGCGQQRQPYSDREC